MKHAPNHPWQTGYPPAGVVVEVWYLASVIPAVWTAQGWRTTEGERLTDITHWRKRSA